MTHSGDVFLADAGRGRRIQVVVLTNNEFNRRAGRVVVAPRLEGPPDAIASPWRVLDDDRVYALDFMLSLDTTRLLELEGHVPEAALRRIRLVMRRIT